jgi:hypothetical protein
MAAGSLLVGALLITTGGPPRPVAHATFVTAAPVIDGDVTDAVWLAAHSVSGFVQQWPDEDRPPSGTTDVRIVYDSHALYFAFRCRDSDPGSVVGRLTRRDSDTNSDAVIIDLDTRGDAQRAFHFEVSAAGVQRDAIRTGDSAVSYDWDAVWQSAVRRTPDGWTAEIAIPFSVLRYEDPAHRRWHLQLRRYVSRRNETDQWAFIPLDVQGEMLHYGWLDGLDKAPAAHPFSLVPFLTGRLRWQYAPPVLGAPSGFDTMGGVGLDAQVGITSGLTLQLTVLPDFGQVEADPAVLNLTTFEVHLDEKRAFFLEGADLFQLADVSGSPVTNQLFYSRRVGASPEAPYVPAGASVAMMPDVTPIWGATKLTGRIGDHIAVALFDGLTASESAAIRLPNGALVNEGLAPLSNFLVGRLRAPVGHDVTAGLTFTTVDRDEPHGSLGLTGLCPNGLAPGPDGRCTHDEQVLAADVSWQPRSGDYAASAMLMGSRVAGGPTAELLDGTDLGSGALGVGARAQVSRISGRVIGNLNFETMSPRMDMNDAGYQPQQNYRSYGGDVGWRTSDHGALLRNTIDLGAAETDTWSGLLLSRGFSVSESATFRSQWAVNVSGGGWEEAYDVREAADGTPVQRPAGWWGSVWAGSNPTQPFTMSAWSGAHTTWRGAGFGSSFAIGARLLNRLELSLYPSVNWQTGDPRHVATVSGPAGAAADNTYLFGLQESFSQSTTLRSTVTFTPNITLQGYAQLFFAAVRYDQLYSNLPDPDLNLSNLTATPGDPHAYDSRGAFLNFSLVFRWEYLPGSTFFLVYTHTQDGGSLPMPLSPEGFPVPARDYDWNALARGQSSDVFLAKLSYYWGR